MMITLIEKGKNNKKNSNDNINKADDDECVYLFIAELLFFLADDCGIFKGSKQSLVWLCARSI